jgi:hypothetical protein
MHNVEELFEAMCVVCHITDFLIVEVLESFLYYYFWGLEVSVEVECRNDVFRTCCVDCSACTPLSP